MTIGRLTIALTVLICCFNLNRASAQNLPKQTQLIKSVGGGAFTAPVGFPQGTSFNINFDQITFNVDVSIPGTTSNWSASSNNGTLIREPFNVVFSAGQHTLLESYTLSVTSSNQLIGQPQIQFAFQQTRTFVAPTSATYKLTINSAIRNVTVELDSEHFIGGAPDTPILGSSFSLTLTSAKMINAGEAIGFAANVTGELSSETKLSDASVTTAVEAKDRFITTWGAIKNAR